MAALVTGFFAANSAALAAPASTPPSGTYVVSHVLVDPRLSNSQNDYENDDPTFIGRIFTLNGDGLHSDTDIPACNAVRNATGNSLGAWLETMFPPDNGNGPRRPDEFGLSVPADALVMVRPYRCRGGDPALPPQAAMLPDGTLLLAWNNREVLLWLVARRGRPTPAFACDKAADVTERRICSDLSLANWDRSLTRRFAAVLKAAAQAFPGQADAKRAALARNQAAWLQSRDRCGPDTGCILSAYQDRMTVLTQAVHDRGIVADIDDPGLRKDLDDYFRSQEH